MIPTLEQFETIKITEKLLNKESSVSASDFYVFDVDVCSTNIDNNYNQLTPFSIETLSKQLNKTQDLSSNIRIFDTNLRKDSNGIFYLKASLYILKEEDSNSIIKKIEKSKSLIIDYVLQVQTAKCSECQMNLFQTYSCGCPHHRKGKIEGKKLNYVSLENAVLSRWILRIM